MINTTADANFFCPDDYEPIFITNFTFPNTSIANSANEICGDDLVCVFDIAATLLPSFGQTTKNSAAALEEENTISGIMISKI